jgi:hypothetical protein
LAFSLKKLLGSYCSLVFLAHGFLVSSWVLGQDIQYLGSPSCGSGSCHNLNQGRGQTGSEYTTWSGFDPHHKAYQVLFDPRSDRIMKNLFHTGSGSAASNQLCLNCHATNRGDTAKSGPGFTLSEGVGCESCHGGSSRYIGIHFTTKVLALSPAEKDSQFGLRNTKELASRAGICADCHIGNLAKGMEVNHDLIAAGHPRLNFELSAFLANYPRHWKHDDELKRHPDFHARAWEVGQVEGSRSAIKLLAERAQQVVQKKDPLWPEFTEFDCFSCHKDLQLNSRNYRNGYPAKPGSLPWGDWFQSSSLKVVLGKSMESSYPADLIREMNSNQKPEKVTRLANAADLALQQSSRHLQSAPAKNLADLRNSMKQLADVGFSKGGRLSWDEGAQLFLGIAALHNAWSDLEPGAIPPAVTMNVEKLRGLLKNSFPKGFDSPKLFEDVFPKSSGANHASDTFETVFASLQSSLVSTRR